MDFTPLTFYAVVCGLLSMLAPMLGGWLFRLGIGAVVGVAAALILPSLQSLMGY